MALGSKEDGSVSRDEKKSPLSISIDKKHRDQVKALKDKYNLKSDSAAFIFAIDNIFEKNLNYDPATKIKGILSLIRETTFDHVALDVKDFIEKTIFPGRKIRVGFAQKIRDAKSVRLKYKYIVPVGATYPIFHYPCTVASWALIEGRIFSFPKDMDRKCDFDRIAKLIKYNEVALMLANLEDSLDDVSKKYIDPGLVIDNFRAGTLRLKDIYQNWVGDQPIMDYCQFVSVPVPIVENVYGHRAPAEYGVINIDTSEAAPLLTNETEPLLALASEIMAIASKFLDS